MYNIMFVCHGNICRSPMAEFVLKDLVKKRGISNQFVIASSATSREEIGNPVHQGTKRKLLEHGISTDGKYAIQFTKEDYHSYDFIIVMDSYNIKNLKYIIGQDIEKKVYKLLDFADGGDIADPWYTGNFDDTYRDVVRGCEGFLRHLGI
ncbi:MAG: low molecular weight phosphotyrosine protein phosphatase [Clostridia bacterium]|nr:low molecular weight phosphotyrosine protein phosphatase [Clostridia bacterium]